MLENTLDQRVPPFVRPMDTRMTERFKLVLGDITKIDVHAVVNSANPRLFRGGGVCGAIHDAAGPRLLAECQTLGGCDPGDAKITGGHLLKARYVIHAVGPVYKGGNSGESEILESCYRRCFEVAVQYGIKTMAFPSIATGTYGYPIKEASKIALRTCKAQLEAFPQIDLVYFVLFSQSNLQWYRMHFHEIVGEQGPDWENLQSVMEALNPNLPFLQEDAVCGRALSRIAEILLAPRSQERLNELDSLIAKVRSRNNRLIEEKCSEAFQVVEDKLAHVAELLDKNRARPDFRNEVLKPFQEAKRAIRNESLIANLAGILEQIEEAFEEGTAMIEERSH